VHALVEHALCDRRGVIGALEVAGERARVRVVRVAPAEDSGLPDAAADLVVVAQALHWFDRTRFYAEAERVLRPGGLLAVWSYARFEADDEGVHRLLEHFYSETVGPCWPPERALVETGYRSLDFPFDEIAVPPFEITADLTLDALAGYLRTWSATQAYLRAHGEDPVPALMRQLEAAGWTPGESRQVRWPLAIRAGYRRQA
jgi:SAM-dependent methyltransferase